MKNLLFLLLLALPLIAGDKYKVFAYMSADKLKTGIYEETNWGNNYFVNFPIDSVNLTVVDIFILFDNQAENVSRSSPWLTVIGGQADSTKYFSGVSQGYPGIVDAAVTAIHAAGKKVLFSVTDQTSQDINYLALDSTRCEGFGRAVAALCHRHNFDGYDVNIENAFESATDAQVTRFFRIAKRTLDAEFTPDSSKIITIVPTPGWWGEYPIGSEPYIDYVMPQYYGDKTAYDTRGLGYTSAAWPGNAYSTNFPAEFQGSNLKDQNFDANDSPPHLIAAGWPAAKIVPGIFSVAYSFAYCDSVGGKMRDNSTGALAETALWYVRDYLLNNGLTDAVNAYTKQRELYGHITDAVPGDDSTDASPGADAGAPYYVTMANDTTAKWLSKYCDSLAMGGIMLWVIDKEMDVTKAKGSGRMATTERVQYWLSTYDEQPPPATIRRRLLVRH